MLPQQKQRNCINIFLDAAFSDCVSREGPDQSADHFHMMPLLLIIDLSAVFPHGDGSSRTHTGCVTTALPPIRCWKCLAVGVREDDRSTIADSSNHGGACELRGTRSWTFRTDSTCFYFVFLLPSVSLLSKIKAWRGGRPV